jgi:hypothetical protein
MATHYRIATAETVIAMLEAIALSAETLGETTQASECHAKASFVRSCGTGFAWRYEVPSSGSAAWWNTAVNAL